LVLAAGVEEGGVEDQVQAVLDVVLNREGSTTVGLCLTSQVLTMKVQIMGKWFAIFLFILPFCSFTANTTQWYISIRASFSSSAYYF
jgi:ABC-type transport system involved in Fe-S cluster assembly fused permease/ATPase subunit